MDQYNKMPPTVQEVFDSLVGDKMLFGSRSMAARWASETFNPAVKIGCIIAADTDWDIAAEFNAENIVALRNAGFTSREGDELYAKDDLTQIIFSKNIVGLDPGDIFAQIVPIHVILRKRNSFFMTVWDNIDAEYYYNHLWKRGPKFTNTRYKGHRDLVKKEIRDAMNQLYASAEFNEFSGNSVKAHIYDLHS
jgi:hypothetical protein